MSSEDTVMSISNFRLRTWTTPFRTLLGHVFFLSVILMQTNVFIDRTSKRYRDNRTSCPLIWSGHWIMNSKLTTDFFLFSLNTFQNYTLIIISFHLLFEQNWDIYMLRIEAAIIITNKKMMSSANYPEIINFFHEFVWK